MKGFLCALAAAATSSVSAHYVLSEFVMDDAPTTAWEFVRKTQNSETNVPLLDIDSPLMRCYETDTAAATSTANVSAGATVGFKANSVFYHKGVLTAYMSLADPAANSDAAGTGQTWFKIWEDLPTYTPGADGQNGTLAFPATDTDTFTFRIPPSVPSGQYLVRGEHIVLDVANTVGGVQFLLGCAQVDVVNGGNGTPGPLTSFPGAYSPTDPGILIDINNLPSNFTGYVAPGPAVWNQ